MEALHQMLVCPLSSRSIAVKCMVCHEYMQCTSDCGISFHRTCGVQAIYALLDAIDDDAQERYAFYISLPLMHKLFDRSYIMESDLRLVPYYFSTRRPDFAIAVLDYFVYRSHTPSLLQLVKNNRSVADWDKKDIDEAAASAINDDDNNNNNNTHPPPQL